MAEPDLHHLTDGAPFAVRVTPKAARNALRWEPGPPPLLRVSVTVVPEDGKANAAVLKLLAKALGVPKSRLELLRGATSRDKLFRVRG
ncbi:hypothetical protein DDZ14_03230 [Maritimibacter sp. 55A14]|uniref:DUF167 domain-containing protein n=1 Tax=Maritimibacter sp. 55A14 TaxID=2174844 RepID=UPI000D60810D|nr:DUF167 domain-containing protein [Maritimibacter sp. 55A14]PWE33694.1 hypothetical protein DDZ14_03230 [Maritimibacter sp. 55A14]